MAKDYEPAYAERMEVDRESVIVNISSEVDRLGMVIDRAYATLDRILEPEYAMADKVGSEPSPVRSYVRETHNSLSNQIERLIRLLDRVEA